MQNDTILIFGPLHNEPPASDPATFDTRNGRPVLDLAEGKTAVFSGVLPQHYDGGGLVIRMHYAMSTATNGNIRLDTAVERVGQVLDIDGDSFATAVQGTNLSVPSTCGILDLASNMHNAGSEMDSLIKGEHFRLSITRASGVVEGADGDLELVSVEVREA